MTAIRDYQPDFYQSFARIQNESRRLKRAEKIIFALQQFGPKNLSELVCVDVGCSAGVITAQLSPLFKQVIGIDYDRTGLAALDSATKGQGHFSHADALRIPMPNQAVDVIICAQVYEHVPDDEMMFAEIYRVLQPGGCCFFSGPNWLFPIEPHYFLPFLHWLPEKWADRYLQLTGQGQHYYERSRSLWGLQQLLHQFEITDITTNILLDYYVANRQSPQALQSIPANIWNLLLPLFPNFNFMLRKPDQSG